MVVLEASSHGLVIISTRVGGIPSLIKDGESGLLIEYGDEDGLIQKIKMAAEDEKLRAELGKNARKRVMEHYNMRRIIDRYVGLYETVLRNKGS